MTPSPLQPNVPFESVAAGAGATSPARVAITRHDLRPGVDMERLIGKPHLFGRLKELRDGFLIEPIGSMTLRADGRVSGYGHPNEGSWIPYEHGGLDRSAAFAFVTAHNHWIPSSTWTQSLSDIPVGFFCDEPESSAALTRLCLLPHPRCPQSAASSVVYLVASCLAFYQRTVPVLLAQLFDEGIPAERIKVVVNGCTEDADETIDGIEYAFSRHDAWEYSTLYEAPLRWDFEYGFLMHDTNVIHPGFRRSVESFNRHLPWDHLPATPLARCLLGLYSHDFLMSLNGWLAGKNGISKKDGVIAEASAELLLRARCALVLGDAERNGAARAAEWGELVDPFDTGTPRVRRAFPSIKLNKFIHAGPADPNKL